MNRKWRYVLGGAAVLFAGGVAILLIGSASGEKAAAQNDPRNDVPVVRLASAGRSVGAERAFTGSIAARVQSNLGFRVAGKIVQRLVDVGQEVTVGQPLMRIDDTDLRLVLTAKRNAVMAATAVAVQARNDEKRYAILSKDGLGASTQRYEQAKAALDTAEAQLAAAEADARVAGNEAGYSTLVADADGIVVATSGEPGQVVVAGQTVVQLAQAGPREALLALPETVRPAIGSSAEATVYGDGARRWPARLRQISNAADPQTRTYEARYVLEGAAAAAPLGATVTIRIANTQADTDIAIPMGAILNDGQRTGVWAFDRSSSTVHFKNVVLKELGEETAVVQGLTPGEPIVALGAHLLKEGTKVSSVAGQQNQVRK
ncbi:efflux RND transporter periplasmic adaptor subunit [Pseudolabrys taiwanensis]|uniref:Efflux RND transporter periplasmic adaptor subunit n=1 Tax=Pseudolabrys taiwanensis TaxID=331696 RepID=A0A345ZWE6_9HYPH|nr:efflux RND transporter periplasmic adaptor subunit [Pseudolabrys taiwanensis]AXK81243.1 efflux RND transporter periplasmic adaptor subunit [Pseudolabrys taiwanensis]